LNEVIQNLKKKVELFVQSQKGTMDKFIKINKINKKWIRKYTWVFFEWRT